MRWREAQAREAAVQETLLRANDADAAVFSMKFAVILVLAALAAAAATTLAPFDDKEILWTKCINISSRCPQPHAFETANL